MGTSYPRRFGKYVLLAPLAQGGMGELHIAFSGRSELRKLCVIKTILTHLADEEFTTRFVDEAKVVVKLSHGNLIPVLEAGSAEGQVFLAMEYIDGKDLRDVWLTCLESQRPFPLDVALYIVREICRGLSYVHQYGDLHLVHRDVSPPNVLLSYTGEVRLTDFGVATSAIKLQKTAPGILLGKLSYMSPEQARNEPVDAQADIYSLGVILWELVTGERMLPPEGDLAQRYEVAIAPRFRPPSRYNPAAPPELDLIASRALAPQRDRRYPDAEEMRRELSLLLGKISPAIDASAVQTLLKELYGPQCQVEQTQRRELIDAMADRVKQLMDRSGSAKAVVRSTDQTSAVPPPGMESSGMESSALDDDIDPGEAPYLRRGTLLGKRYEIEEPLGEGGMGRVYLATHVDIGKKVAVKVLHPSYSRMPDLVSRFRREARAASKIGHPHIVEVYDSGKTPDGSIYFVMEYLVGIDLADVLSSEGRLGIERSIRIGIRVCEAVAAAHEAGIIHRDLKPENIFLCTREGTPDFVKVLDFGLAQSTGLEESRKERLTNPGMAMGTPEYMAPEQAAGQKTDHRADVYAVGTLLYEMLVGRPPHMGDNIMEVFNRKAVEPIVPPSERRKDVPADVERVVMWALEYDADRRPQTMAQLAYELTKLARGRAGAVASMLGIPDMVRDVSGPARAITDDEDFSAESYTPPADGQRRRWVWPAMALVAVGLSVTIAVVRYLRPDQQGADRVRAVADANVSPDFTLAMPTPTPDLVTAAVVRPDSAPAPVDSARSGAKPVHRSSVAAGRRYLLAGQFDEARAAFTRAMRTRRYRGQAKLGLAEVEFQLGRFKEAEQFAHQAVSLDGGWRAQLVLANVHYRLRDYKQAIGLYETVLKRKPNQPEARRNLVAARRRLSQ